MEVLSKRILELRHQHNLKQEDAAEQIGIQYRSYRRYEQGEREPLASVIVLLARFYGVSADYLLGLTDEP